MTQAIYDKYVADHATFEASPGVNGPAWLGKLRATGLAAFKQSGFPTATRGNEQWKYTNVAPIGRATFDLPSPKADGAVSLDRVKAVSPWDDGWSRLVFVDGIYSATLSVALADDIAQVTSLSEVLSVDGVQVEQHFGKYVNVDEDGFTAVNTAFARDGAFVWIPDDSAATAPVHLVFVSTGSPTATVSHPRVLVLVGRNSRLTLVESYVSLGDGTYFTNAVAEIVGEEGSEIEHYRYLAESDAAFHIGTTSIALQRDASFLSTSLSKGARIARNGLSVLLDGPGSSCVLKGLYATSGKQHIDNHIAVDHKTPHGSSDQLFKGILDGSSRAVFSGRVLVRKDAQKTYATQSDKNLLLSEGARINTKPSLEIYADDVQCAHGATAGAIADEALFYMASRGLDDDTARRLLVVGFANEIIDGVRLAPLRRQMQSQISVETTRGSAG
ncbi:MAG: Fe-S cluster assembly protein SufD [SAR202 cluster bacterium]|nr:Fe-S cluster assembly protein SufD [SAR202 cluster bacterium]